MLEDEIIVACSRLSFSDKHRECVVSACARGGVDWDLVYSAAIAHKVAPLIHQNLWNCGMDHASLPMQVMDEFREVSRRHSARNMIVAKETAAVVAYFEGRSHDVMLLKHAAFRVRMPELHDVTMSDDVDVVVRPKGESVDRSGGRYRWAAYKTPDPSWDVIDEFLSSADHGRYLSKFEVDNRLHHDVVWNGVVPIDFRRVWEAASRGRLGGVPVYVPDVHDLIVMGAVNLFRKPYLRLRNLAEIHELARREEGLDWGVLIRKSREHGCQSLVYSALHATRAILGSDLPESELKALKPGLLRGRAVAVVDSHTHPCAVCRPRHQDRSLRHARRRLEDVARRFLALDARQLMRFLKYRIVLPRIARWTGS